LQRLVISSVVPKKNALIRKAAGKVPVLFVSADERFFPADAKRYVEHCALWRAQAPFDAARASVPGLAVKVITSINDIMEEKYVAMFQNIEVWNDYKRSCYPAIAAIQPPNAPAAFGGKVPGRLYYGTTEQNANPNVPNRSVQNQFGGNVVTTPPATAGFRNPNDPNPCP